MKREVLLFTAVIGVILPLPALADDLNGLGISFAYYMAPSPEPSAPLGPGDRITLEPRSGVDGDRGVFEAGWVPRRILSVEEAPVEGFIADITSPGLGSCRLTWMTHHIGSRGRRRLEAVRGAIERGNLGSALVVLAWPSTALQLGVVSSRRNVVTRRHEIELQGRPPTGDRIGLICRLAPEPSLSDLRSLMGTVGRVEPAPSGHLVDLGPSTADHDASPRVSVTDGSEEPRSRALPPF